MSTTLQSTIAKNTRYKWLGNILSNELPNPDKILKDIGNRISSLTDLRTDTHLASIIQSRKSGVLSLEWELLFDDNSPIQSDFLQDIFNNLDLNNIISEMLEAPLYGYKFLEIVWRIENGQLLPKDIIGKPCEWFVFNENNIPYFVDSSNQKHHANSNKFLILQNNASYNNPYGEAILSKCFWSIFFKKEAVKSWATFLEDYGLPFLVAENDGNSVVNDTNDTSKDLLEQLEDMRQGGRAVPPQGWKISALDVSGASSPAIFEANIHYHNSEMSKAILSQTLTTEQGTSGSYAMSQTHLQVRSDVIDADKKMVENAFNELIKKIYQLNFNQTKDLPKFRMYQEEDVNKPLAELLKILDEIGFEVSEGFASKEFGIPIEDIKKKIQQATQPMFSEEEHNHGLEDDETGIDDYAKATNKMLNYAISLIKNMEDIDEAKQKIVDAYPNLDSSEMEQFLETAEIAARLGGTLNAD